jgi:hypothetical protein
MKSVIVANIRKDVNNIQSMENMFYSIELRIRDEIGNDAKPYRTWWKKLLNGNIEASSTTLFYATRIDLERKRNRFEHKLTF